MDFDPLSDLPEAAKAGLLWPGSWEFHGDLRGIYMGIDMGISMRNVDLLGIEWELMGFIWIWLGFIMGLIDDLQWELSY